VTSVFAGECRSASSVESRRVRLYFGRLLDQALTNSAGHSHDCRLGQSVEVLGVFNRVAPSTSVVITSLDCHKVEGASMSCDGLGERLVPFTGTAPRLFVESILASPAGPAAGHEVRAACLRSWRRFPSM
jgi:hypothetical protein